MTIIKHDFQRTRDLADKGNEKKTIPGFRLHIDLGYSSPPIWRSLRLPGIMTLADLHSVIQHCFGWQGDEPYRFLVGKVFYGPHERATTGGSRSADTPLHELEEHMGFIFSYLYDGGCGWECEIRLEELIPDTRDVPFPELVAAEGASPPSSIEDIHDYLALLRRLEENGQERMQLLAAHGLPPDFHAEICDIEGINSRLRSTTP